jgi:transcriptional regulator with XRE-family HTH domain
MKPEPSTEFSKLILKSRIQANLSLREAALKLNISHGNLSEMENGLRRNPTAETLNAFRRVYKLSAKKLLDSLE